MIVALTGGIGAGKSSVAEQIAKQCRGDYFNIDEYCRWLLEKGNPGWRGVVKQWGQHFLGQNGEIDRVLLRQEIFADDITRKQLEQIVHPLARSHVLEIKRNYMDKWSLLVVEVPLLFEVGWTEDFDVIVTVIADEVVCLERIVMRDKVSKEDAQKIIDTQMPMEEKAGLSDFVVNNSANWDDTMAQIAQLCIDFKSVSGVAK